MKNDKTTVARIIMMSIVGLTILMITLFIGIRCYLDEKEVSTYQVIERSAMINTTNVEYSLTTLVLVESLTEKYISVYDLENKRRIAWPITTSTRFYDLDGVSISSEEIKDGDIVEIVYQEEKNKVLSINRTKRAWVLEDVSGICVDEEENRITLEGIHYRYIKDLLVLNVEGSKINLGDISPYDTLEVKGVGGVIWSIIVQQEEAKIGFREIPEGQGSIIIDTKNILDLSDIDDEIPVIAGKHKIEIKIPGYEKLEKIVYLQGGAKRVLSLKGLKIVESKLE